MKQQKQQESQPGSMREFLDQNGREWIVYAVNDSPTEGATRRYLPDAYQRGWLVFESGERKMRLAPVPGGWADLRDEELCSLLAAARPTTPTLPEGHRPWVPGARGDAKGDARR